MRPNRAKCLLAEGKTVLGTFVGLMDPAVVEIAAAAGFDFVIVDLEHWLHSTETVLQMFRAAGAAGITCIVRVPDHEPKRLLRLLDGGSDGFLVPAVSTAEEAAALVDAVRYAPAGSRGLTGSSRSAGYSSIPFARHAAESNEQVLLAVMVEDPAGVENLEAILATPGIDVVYMGPMDLSAHLGLLGQSNPPEVRRIVEDCAARVSRVKGAVLGMPAYHPTCSMTPAELTALGMRFITPLPMDAPLLYRAFRDLVTQSRAELGS